MPEVVAVIDEAEASLATMREALELAEPYNTDAYEKKQAALASDAGRSTLERIKRLERVAEVAKTLQTGGVNGPNLYALDAALDSLEAEAK